MSGQRIEKWGVVGGNRLAGTVFDRPGHKDGGMIVTSPVVEIRMLGAGTWPGTYPVAFTESGSAYRLGEPSPSFGTDCADGFIRSKLSARGLPIEPGRSRPDREAPVVRAALDTALDALVESRRTEGRALREDFRARMNAIETHRRRVEELAPQREERERDRLREKVRALLDEQADADARIEAEIVLLADRVDVSEELTRLRAHLDHFAAELESGAGSVGRKLTFILQELGREANTIGSKASDPEIQKSAIEIKAELEKMREQAENVE